MPKSDSLRLVAQEMGEAFSSRLQFGSRSRAGSFGRLAHAICIRRRLRNMSKRVPRFRSDEEAERFLEQDLTDYIQRDAMPPVRFELKPKDTSISLRLSQHLLQEVRSAAEHEGVSYQKFIRHAVEEAVHRARRSPR